MEWGTHDEHTTNTRRTHDEHNMIPQDICAHELPNRFEKRIRERLVDDHFSSMVPVVPLLSPLFSSSPAGAMGQRRIRARTMRLRMRAAPPGLGTANSFFRWGAPGGPSGWCCGGVAIMMIMRSGEVGRGRRQIHYETRGGGG